MSDDQTQISAFIAAETKARLDRYVAESGVKKARVIEDALASYLVALDEVPAEYVIPRRLTVSNDTMDRMLERAEHASPAPALRTIMRGRAPIRESDANQTP